MESDDCLHCGATDRRLHVYSNAPEFEEIEVGNWTILERCPRCDQLWVEQPYEPYASYPFWVAWPGTEAQFWAIHDNNSRALYEWHAAVIREDGPSLDGKERHALDFWRERTYRNYNPIDRPDYEDSRESITKSEDIWDVLDDLE